MTHSHDRTDPRFIAQLRPLLGWFYDHYFRVGFHGADHIPRQGPALLVSNHNGIMGAEIFMILEGWLRARGQPKVLALAHDVVFSHPTLKTWVPRLGAIPASEELALEAFDKGYSVLVYPGGDREAFRPFSKRAEVDFDGRQGYARLALKAGVPIVPVTNVGGHEQSIVLWRADGLASRLPVCRKFRIRGLPITLRGLPFLPGLFLGPLASPALVAYMASTLFPLPAKMDFYFGEAIDPKGHSAESLDLRTRQAIQERLAAEYAKPRIPLYGPKKGRKPAKSAGHSR